MDYPQTGHPHGHHYREDPQSVGLNSVVEGEDHHEKKSVLKRVKDKAKKIKDTITKHGHGQHHDEHGQEFDEEDDEDEEMVEEPVVQSGPICESSTVIRSRTVPVEELYSGQRRPNWERTTAMKEDPLVPKDRTDASFPSQAPGKEDASRQYGDNMGRPTAMEDQPYAPDEHAKEGNPEKSRVNLGASMGLEEDPHSPKDRPEAVDPPNYQTKVADPTGDGGEEVGITPIISSFDKMSVQNKPEQQFSTGSGSHDQFFPESLPTEAKTTEDTQDTNNAEKPSNQKTYTEKISTAAISAKNTVASKLGYGGTDKGEEMCDGGEEVGITPIISSFDKMSVQDKPEQQFSTGSGSHDQFFPESLPTEAKTTEDTQDTNNAEKPSNQKTYTEKISTAAISAKNTVASKLGYGGTDKGEEMCEGGDQTAKTASSVTEYGKKIPNTVTEKLSPVDGKVAEAGSAVMSKVQGTGSEREGPKEHDKGSEEEGYRAPDKGVPMKACFAEKLKPGEEDRALSEVILDSLHKRKEEPEHENKSSKPMGKVTESEEVARRLGTENKPSVEGSDSGDVKFDSSSSVSSGSGVVDKLRGAVSSWFGKGGESQTPP